LNEINSSIQKKHQLKDFDDVPIEETKQNVIQTIDDLQKILVKQTAKSSDPIKLSLSTEENKSTSKKESCEKQETKNAPVFKQDNISFDFIGDPLEQSVDEYNKSIEDLNNRQFDEKVDELSNNDEQLENISESQRLKVDEDNNKFDDSNASNQLIQETRSEEGKEDEHKLEDSIQKKKKKLVYQENKTKRNSENRKFVDPQIEPKKNIKANAKQTKQKNLQDNPVKLEEVKHNRKLKKSCDSEPDNGFQSPHQEEADLQDMYNDPSFAGSSEKNLNMHISITADI
jgi:hypothetical protein